ncbi:MAG: hypothetical protein Q7S17_05770 [Xanthobacteraceae bacterium]|nr:hypothetical protein [Xanthobacteraceae bacterium]
MSRTFEGLSGGPYGGMPGFKTGGTSKAAADAIAGSVEELRRRVLAELPGTAEEIAGRLGLRRDQVAPRLSELTKGHLARAIKTKTRRRNSESGLTAAVYDAIAGNAL